MLYKNCALLFSCLLCVHPLQAHHESADYVIIGVGTAGGLVAKKLSDDKKTSVIALHAGSNFTQTPLIKYSANSVITVPSVLTGPPIGESGLTIPQTNADDRVLAWAIPLPEGGGSSINAGAYCRGTKELYAQWEAIAGKKWSVKRIFNLYKELENYHGNTKNPRSRGDHGPLNVTQVTRASKVSQVFTKAIINATGFPFVLDYNDPKTPIGASSQLQYTQIGDHRKFRVSSASSFLDEDVMTSTGHGVNGRKLRIHFNSMALKTIWKGNKAIGVKYLQDGKVKKVFARKGVIVCAGLRSSPFLMYSGVGPKALLDSLQIPVKFDNPNVGQGLVDQTSIRMGFSSNPKDISLNPNGIFSQIAWLPTPGGNPTKRELRFATITQAPGTTLCVLDLCQPKSRGSVSINSANPLAPPVIDLGVLSDPSDLSTFQQALQVYIKAINTALQSIDPTYKLIFPDPAILDDASLVQAFIQENVACNQTFQSHCRMAAITNGGVVDSRGRVYGVRNLIVADNSIVPLCMDGSPMATGYLIGANVAKILIEKE